MKTLRTWKSDYHEMASEDYILPDNLDNLEFLNLNASSLMLYQAKYITEINDGIVNAYELNSDLQVVTMDVNDFIKNKFG